ncbi:MAG TPA: SDR family NAD(P)-dependent oxidoreductase [Anaerolineales bacterium]|nr:SDR family NAD(P)-dependent oxidoreductase [Anaerolineales bacterium]
MNTEMKLENRTAVVTGAASGIGRGLAGALARRRCHLALADINEAGLERTVELVATPGLRISCHRLDVSNAEAVAGFPQVVLTSHPGVDLLFNVAGVALWGTFEQISDADFEWLFGINFHGLVRMTRAFLPLLKKSDDARLVNMSSVFGLIGPPGQTAYAASKFAVRGFSEALRHELEGSHVGVTVVHPGGIATAIAETARVSAGISNEELETERANSRKLLTLSPEVAAETIVRGVERRKARVLIGTDAKAIDIMARVAPVSYRRVLERLLQNR